MAVAEAAVVMLDDDEALLRRLAVAVESQIDFDAEWRETTDLEALCEALNRPAFIRDGEAPC